MKILVISDTHANWQALQAVLADAQGGFDRIVCCGDLVGYNSRPAQVLEWTREHCEEVIRGNHDKVVAGLEDLDWFNEVAQVAARWTMNQLNQEQLAYLHNLRHGPVQLEHFQMCHGSPQDEDEYVTTAHEAVACFQWFDSPLVFFGHTHLQGGFFARRGRVGTIPAVKRTKEEGVVALEPDTLYMVNPGSVGQPRDGDPRAAYAIFDSDQRVIMLRRVEYPIQEAAEEVIRAGLPDVLALRLFQGF